MNPEANSDFSREQYTSFKARRAQPPADLRSAYAATHLSGLRLRASEARDISLIQTRLRALKAAEKPTEA